MVIEMEYKYIQLLLDRCLKIEECNSLFINYNILNKDFVSKVVSYAKNKGINDIYLDEENSMHIHKILQEITIDEIGNNDICNSHMWDEYAKKDAAFLILDTEIPKIMDDIDSELLAKYAYLKRENKPLYKEKQMNSLIPWCIAVLPNEYWAKKIFPNSKNPVNEFWDVISKMCMLDKKEPIKEWDKLLNKQSEIMKKLNDLKIQKLHYKNSLGTNLTIELSKDAIWQSASSNKWIVNMPSYEIFSTPDYRKTNGIVYSSKPLIYNGKIINDFYLIFKNGKVEEINAKEGLDVLKEIINGDELSSYLGEIAIVNYNSPISNTNLVFESTLYDENASCHLALGNGFIECINNGDKLSKVELENIGVNFSKNHVDFMIGTEDLTIEAETYNKDNVMIMKNGNLII